MRLEALVQPSRRKRNHEEEHPKEMVHDESNWLVSYADMMTLLFGFFVLMYSFSKIDEEKFEVVRKDLVKYFGGSLKEASFAWSIKKNIEQKITNMMGQGGFKDQQMSIKVQDNSLKLSMQSQLLFAPGSSELTIESARLIDTVAQELKKLPLEQVEVEGHTDIDPIKSYVYPSNWELSTARASRIVRRIAENGMKEDFLVAKGYGSSRPEFPHLDEKGVSIEANKEKNRRVVIEIKLKPQQQNISYEQIEKMGFRKTASIEDQQKIEELAEKKAQIDDMKKKLQDAQARFQEANQKLRSAQDLEKSVKEMETIAKKTEEVERKIQSIEKKAEETLTRTQKTLTPDSTQSKPHETDKKTNEKEQK